MSTYDARCEMPSSCVLTRSFLTKRLVKVLLEYKADPNGFVGKLCRDGKSQFLAKVHEDEAFETPMHVACQYPITMARQVVETLLRAKGRADVTDFDTARLTPLMTAARCGANSTLREIMRHTPHGTERATLCK